MLRVTARWLLLVCALTASATMADETPTATIVGVPVALDKNGRLAGVSEATRRQLIENLRASFAAQGVDAKTGPLAVSADGVESMRVGLDRTTLRVARIDEHGDLQMLCVQGDQNAAAFLAGAPLQ